MEKLLYITCLYLIMPMLLLSVVIIFIRMIKGPVLPDRVVSIDLLVTTTMALIAVFSILNHENAYVDVIVVLAILMFLSTVGFAYYYQQKGED